MSDKPNAADHALAREVIAWFRREARALPWRDRPLGRRRDPYRVLVSELMLQQTQAPRVAPRFEEFLARFPTIDALASAPEDHVLAAWTGLGYYRRARQLHAAAREVVSRGAFPRDPDGLRALPGVGRYTAGSIASLAFAARTPVADANVARILLRLHARPGSARHAADMAWVWARAAALVAATRGVRAGSALLNEGLMELGATVCLPRAPACHRCPLAPRCRARALGLERQIPTAQPAKAKPVIHCATLLALDTRGRILVERRGDRGLWAGLWQAPTVERAGRPWSAASVRAAFGLSAAPARGPALAFQTTHRELRFVAWRAPEGARPARLGSTWMTPAAIERLGMSSPQRRLVLGGR